jgi:AcrR family transcriptional regulator
MPATKKKIETRQQGRPSSASAVGREGILAAVRIALRTTPPGELTFKQVADIAGIDQRLIRYYFGALPDLLRDVAIEITEELRDRFKAEDDRGRQARGVSQDIARKRLRARVMIFLDFFGSNPHYHRLLVDFLINAKGPQSDAAVARFRSSIDELHDLLKQCSPNRRVSKFDAQLIHVSVAAMCEYIFSAEAIFMALFGSNASDPSFRTKFCDFVTRFILGSFIASDESKT